MNELSTLLSILFTHNAKKLFTKTINTYILNHRFVKFCKSYLNLHFVM